MDPKVWNGTDRICLTYLSTQTQNTPFIGSTFLRPAYGIWKRKMSGESKRKICDHLVWGPLCFLRSHKHSLEKILMKILLKMNSRISTKGTCHGSSFPSSFRFHLPLEKKILVLLPLLLLLFLPGPSFKFNQLKFITRTDLPQQNIWAIEQTLIGIRKMT